MKPKLHVRFWSRAGMAPFRLRQRHQEFDVLLYPIAAIAPGIWDKPQGAGCERDRDNNAESDLSSEMPNSGEPVAMKVCVVVRNVESLFQTGGV